MDLSKKWSKENILKEKIYDCENLHYSDLNYYENKSDTLLLTKDIINSFAEEVRITNGKFIIKATKKAYIIYPVFTWIVMFFMGWNSNHNFVNIIILSTIFSLLFILIICTSTIISKCINSSKKIKYYTGYLEFKCYINGNRGIKYKYLLWSDLKRKKVLKRFSNVSINEKFLTWENSKISTVFKEHNPKKVCIAYVNNTLFLVTRNINIKENGDN